MSDPGRLTGLAVVVIGAGIVGTTITHALASSGARVRLVERRYPGSGTSGHTVAWLNAFGKKPRHYHDLNVDGIQAHKRLQDQLGGQWLQLGGGWHWEDETGAGFCDDLASTIARLRAWGTDVERVPIESISDREPALVLDPERVREAFLVHDEGWLYPGLMIQTLLSSARHQHGVELVADTVTDLSTGTGVQSVRLSSGSRLDADVVVVAAGAATDEIAALAGVHIPLRRNVGVLGITAPSPADLRRVVIGPQIIARPDGAGRLLIGSSETLDVAIDTELTPTSDPVRRMQRQAQTVLPDLAGVPLESLRRGIRVVPDDGLPVIGRADDPDGPYLVVTHSGVTLAAALAELVVDDLAAGECPTLDHYRPTRFRQR